MSSDDDIMSKNRRVLNDYNDRMKKYENDGSKGPKPRCSPTISAITACYCFSMNCFFTGKSEAVQEGNGTNDEALAFAGTSLLK
eukprot:CAMPEP_0172484568 /NCGR_PEP_ID=MMETSP1066-20121228/12082_1 /TAXON_ID=671091 /ORGANISM="Coscinodiscus wailesii, Strain CCMP2513" /LENGTH=83 /DNA_ID=CAMNT_0013249185 /DNA_START=266 /DNA_END=514 /DNA_ORIENTATION=+